MIELNRKLGKSTFRVRDVNNAIQIQSSAHPMSKDTENLDIFNYINLRWHL